VWVVFGVESYQSAQQMNHLSSQQNDQEKYSHTATRSLQQRYKKYKIIKNKKQFI